jgi:hypothetical protein
LIFSNRSTTQQLHIAPNNGSLYQSIPRPHLHAPLPPRLASPAPDPTPTTYLDRSNILPVRTLELHPPNRTSTSTSTGSTLIQLQ